MLISFILLITCSDHLIIIKESAFLKNGCFFSSQNFDLNNNDILFFNETN